MEIETGAAVSLISENTQKELFPDASLDASQVELTTYTGERMDVVGQWSVQANYGQQSKTLPLIVVTGDGRASLEEIGYSIYASTGRRSEKSPRNKHQEALSHSSSSTLRYSGMS